MPESPSSPKSPSFSIIIPTIGRGDLSLTLQSIATQELHPDDQILIVGDGPQTAIWEQVEAIGPPFRYIDGPPSGDWGHTQQNYALQFCQGTHVSTQGDDDVFTPRAFELIRKAISGAPHVPHMFRFWTNDRLLKWSEEDEHKLEETMVGDHNLFAPNIPEKLGRWASNYRGDLAFVKGTIRHYPEVEVQWHKTIITRQRPNTKLLAWPVSGEEREALFRKFCSVLPDDDLPYLNKPFWRYIYSLRGESPVKYIGWGTLSTNSSVLLMDFHLLDEFKGKGLARFIVQHLIDAANSEIWWEVTSPELENLAKTMGFRRTEGRGVGELYIRDQDV